MATDVRRSACSRDCPDACGLVATVEDGRIVKLAGDPDHPVTQGFVCFRTSRFAARLEAPDRLTRPLLRKRGELCEVSFDEALDHAAERLCRIRDESGPEAIFHYRSGGSLGLLKLVADRFFERFGPCATKIGDVCSGAGEAAQSLDFGTSDSNDLFDLLESRHIHLWGKNPFVSNVHLVPILKRARKAGAQVTLIDPVHHRGVALADTYVQPRPGGDLALALGAARVLLDDGFARRDLAACANFEAFEALVNSRTATEHAADADVTEAELRALATTFVDGPTAILVGWGMGRRSRGGATVRALDALSAISGNLFRSGGGCSFYFKRRGPFDVEAVSDGSAARRIREPLFGEDVLAAKDPPIRAIWITAGNPVCTLPDSTRVAQALESTEFVVVVDPFLTDTARRADLVIPVPTFLEDSDLLGAYGHHWIAESRPLVDPPDGMPHEVELFQGLARRTGLDDAFAATVDDYKRRLLAPLADHGVTLDTLRERGAVRNPLSKDVLFLDREVRTGSGKVELIGELSPEPEPAGADYPLWLFSNSTAKAQATQWAIDHPDPIEVTVHPTRAPDGLRDGDLVVVESAIGRIEARLALDPAQREDVALVPKGGHFDRGQSANALIRARATDLGLGAAYLDCRVRVGKP
jgi:anaerobic selenocysteine-containing dehydrogenase